MVCTGHEEVFIIRDPTNPPMKSTTDRAPFTLLASLRSPQRLRTLLLSCDASAAIVGWGLLGGTTLWGSNGPQTRQQIILVVLGVSVTLLTLGWQQLYKSRVCAVRSVELQRVARAMVTTAIFMAFAGHYLGLTDHLLAVTAASLAVLVLLVVSRSTYRAWLGARRRRGEFTRRVVLVGGDAETVLLATSLREHPEAGLELCGFVSSPEQAGIAARVEAPWLGPLEGVEGALRDAGANGAVLITSALSSQQLDAFARTLPAAGYHVHVSSGLHGIAPQRLRPVPLGYDPMLYIEPVALPVWQKRLKRDVDILLGTVSLVLAAPVLLAAAAAIKLEDRGPVLFRQPRVGLNNETFTILKLRSMTVDAETQVAGLAERNHRADGPLFKVADDPRVTRCGRVLRRMSIDELPQLINVLRGDMSLVGPRPALAVESEQFDRELQNRVVVPPGITGLWQIEARDNPAFGPYRRLDLYYVENWSVGLDLSILVATAFVVLRRAVSALPLAPRTTVEPSPTTVPLD